jgi:hypothetical protein
MLNKQVKPIWLASYPKSGNTWSSLFLSVLLNQKDLNINEMGFETIISDRSIIDAGLGVNSSDLPETDYIIYRSQLYHKWANSFLDKDYILVKVHDACSIGEQVLFTPAITRGVIYIMRNPFDMAASWANHARISIEKAVKDICSPTHGLAKNKTKLNNQISQHMGTWHEHIKSWTDVHHANMQIIKYENLINDGLNEFTKMVNYMELAYTASEIETAIAKTAFTNLQKQEKVTKFRLNPAIDNFFRAGKTGGWRNEITMDQAKLIIDTNYDSLLKYGYITKDGEILV